MSELRDRLSRHDDSEESLITQFETTLTIKPTSNDVEEIQDLTMAHTTMDYSREHSEIDIEQLEEKELRDEQIPKFKTKRRYSLQPNLASKQVTRSSSASPTYQLDSKYDEILKLSPLIDESLERYNKAFSEFLRSNSHIETESPQLARETDKTLVVLSPFSAEHAFGRKWVSKSYLSTIFEKPQRLLASCIGVSAAVTMYPFFYKVVNSTKRGSLFSNHVRRIHGKNWPKKLFELCLDSHERLSNDELEVPEDWNTGDIYLNPRTINALEGVIGAIETAVDSLLGSKKESHDLGFVVIRPPGHHSHACLPSGFCLLNNVQIAIEYAYEKHEITHCAILDIDLHHGDGSQDICWERAGFFGDYGQDEEDELDAASNPRDEYGKRFATFPKVGYFSIHDIKSYPTEMGFATKENIKNASTCIMDHDLTIWNVHLQKWDTEEEFYKHYSTKYVAILNRASTFLNDAKKEYEKERQQYLLDMAKYNKYSLRPRLYRETMVKPEPPKPFKPLIVISAGFDASEYENPQMQRHGINVPTSFYARFTKDVVKLAKIHTNAKILSFMEGGYSDGALSTGIFSHLIGLTKGEDLLWNQTWGAEQVMKELVKGCKANWAPYKKPLSGVTVWANEVIKLGRSMMPNAILPAKYIYQYQDPEEVSPNRMVKNIVDDAPSLRSTVLESDPDKADRVRHTRSYFKKLASN